MDVGGCQSNQSELVLVHNSFKNLMIADADADADGCAQLLQELNDLSTQRIFIDVYLFCCPTQWPLYDHL